MGPVVMSMFVALLTAAGVFLLCASLTGATSSMRGFFADLYAGLRRDEEQRAPRLRDEVRELADLDDEATVDQLFVVGQPDPVGYVDAEQLAAGIQRAGAVVRGGVTHLARR
jgi:hypothetical protein